ncbi:phage/plasmid replication protein, II/X family, partial [Escherichia coli]|nr:phage/plasmid replication protein, II/X family [Escherichia coli]
MVNEGYLEVKRSFSVTKTFYNNFNLLLDAGFTKAQLQNLQGNGMNKVVPLVDVITVDFSQQYPDWYVEPEFGALTRQLLANDNVVQL